MKRAGTAIGLQWFAEYLSLAALTYGYNADSHVRKAISWPLRWDKSLRSTAGDQLTGWWYGLRAFWPRLWRLDVRMSASCSWILASQHAIASSLAPKRIKKHIWLRNLAFPRGEVLMEPGTEQLRSPGRQGQCNFWLCAAL